MSTEITKGNDYSVADDAAHLAGILLCETGSTTSEAYSYGIKAARYGAEVLLVALREMGAVSGELDQTLFRDALQEVDKQILPSGHVVVATRLGEELVLHKPNELAFLLDSDESLADMWNRLADDPKSGITEQMRAAIIAGRAGK